MSKAGMLNLISEMGDSGDEANELNNKMCVSLKGRNNLYKEATSDDPPFISRAMV